MGVAGLALVTFEHVSKAIDTFIACFAEITDNSFTHLCLLLVHFELSRDLLSILDKIGQVSLLSTVTIFDLTNILASNMQSNLLELLLMLSFGHERLLIVLAILRVLKE